MPLLVQHLHAHEAGNKNETVWNFMVDHYLKDSDKDPDYAADMQLPFKEQNACVAYNISTIVVIQTQTFITLKPVVKQQRTYSFYTQPSLSCTNPSNIWQPPKSC